MIESTIRLSLANLLVGIQCGDAGTIAAETEALDSALATQRGQLHPQLVHLLERRSYAKALVYLGGELETTIGGCGCRPAKARS